MAASEEPRGFFGEDTCAICLEETTDLVCSKYLENLRGCDRCCMLEKCSHTFHWSCINAWWK
eukprot:1392679-Amorphochlora_amoeboformis.AAC.2